MIIGNKRIKELEARISVLEMEQNSIHEANTELFGLHRQEQQTAQAQLELLEGMPRQREWMKSRIIRLSFATAGLLVGLLDSRSKATALKKIMNEG